MNRPNGMEMNLPCKLTEPELLKIGSDLVARHRKKSEIEGKLREHNKKVKEGIAVIDAEIEALLIKIETQREERPIDCKIEYDWKKKKKTWTRTDTNEVAKTATLTDLEYQEHMEFEKKDKNLKDNIKNFKPGTMERSLKRTVKKKPDKNKK